MKKLHQLLFVMILVAGISTVFAQDKVFKEGSLTYKMNMHRTDPNYGEVDMTSDIKMKIKGNEVKTEVNTMVSGVNYMNMTTTLNRDAQTGVLLIDAMGQKMASKITPADYLEFTKKQTQLLDPENVEIVNETTTILGYKCKKAIVTNKDGQKATVYFTSELGKINTLDGSTLSIKGVDGIPLKISVSGADGSVTMEAASITSGGVSASEFSYDVPSGYTEIDYKTLAAGAGM